jgi:hypothetical protein
MNQPLSVDAQVRMMIAALAASRLEMRGRTNNGVRWLVERFRPAPPVFWRLIKTLTDYR